MKPYGVKREDRGCCPGHDKYPSEPYKIWTRRKFKRQNRHAKKSIRSLIKRIISRLINEN